MPLMDQMYLSIIQTYVPHGHVPGTYTILRHHSETPIHLASAPIAKIGIIVPYAHFRLGYLTSQWDSTKSNCLQYHVQENVLE